MTDLERAKTYITQMARGFNPITGEKLIDADIVNNVEVRRCLFYVSSLLSEITDEVGSVIKEIKEDKKKTEKYPFTITEDEKNGFVYSDEPLLISGIVKRINDCARHENMYMLVPVSITSVLLNAGILEIQTNLNGSVFRAPSDLGLALGMSTEEREKDGERILVTLYSKEAQKFVVENLESILAEDVESLIAKTDGIITETVIKTETTNGQEKKRCRDCWNYKNGSCCAIRKADDCADYWFMPAATEDERAMWPREGTATAIRMRNERKNGQH